MKNRKLKLSEIIFITSSGRFGDGSKRNITFSEMVKTKDLLIEQNRKKNYTKKFNKMQADWNETNYKEVARDIKNEW
jgi:hypothetical protein